MLLSKVARQYNTDYSSVMEVNPSLMQEKDAEQTIAIGCSLIRSAFGESVMSKDINSDRVDL